VNRREFLHRSARFMAASTIAPGLVSGAPPSGKPNIVLIVSDDHGYADIGLQGCTDVPTPNIDSIGRNGVRFGNGYVSCPVCSPTRAGLATGRYQQRFGHEFNPGPPSAENHDFGLSLHEVTLAERLKKAGYATGMFGKWHLGFLPQFHPMKRGFDEFFGFLGGMHSYLDPQGDREGAVLRGTQAVNEKDFYTTDAFTREAVSFIERHKSQPFFLYLPYNGVHLPLEAPERYLARFPKIGDEKRRTFAAMLSALDDGVGRVLATLRKNGLEENTLLFFISDNGGPPANTSRNHPFGGFKGQVLEGGIHVPFLMQWRGRLPAGKVYDAPVISLDIHPTALAAATGVLPPDAKFDGVDLLPFLTGKKKGLPHDRLFWRFGEQSAVRMGDWKLLRMGDEPPELYNLPKDPGEKNDLATQLPEKVKELQAGYDLWNAQLMKPRFGRGRPIVPKSAREGQAGGAAP